LFYLGTSNCLKKKCLRTETHENAPKRNLFVNHSSTDFDGLRSRRAAPGLKAVRVINE
jgi:hypothetical protein